MKNSRMRISPEMEICESVIVMCEGNPGAITCVSKLLSEDSLSGFLDLLLLDSLGIYGSKIYMIWNDSCGRDMEKFKKTLEAFREGKISEEEIHKNLAHVRAEPFI